MDINFFLKIAFEITCISYFYREGNNKKTPESIFHHSLTGLKNTYLLSIEYLDT